MQELQTKSAEFKKVADDVLATYQHKVDTQRNEIEFLKKEIDKNNQNHSKEMTTLRDFANGINQGLMNLNDSLVKEVQELREELSIYKRMVAQRPSKVVVASTTKPISETISDLITYGKKSFGNSVPIDYFIESITKVGQSIMEGDGKSPIRPLLQRTDQTLHDLIHEFSETEKNEDCLSIIKMLEDAHWAIHEYDFKLSQTKKNIS